jgi:glutamate N-acetyltransferase/amino-acid N-acetyltransferase
MASGLSVGLKENGNSDLSLVVSADLNKVPTAAVFTKNKFAAAPVRLSQANLGNSKGFAVGVMLNSGCANAATGEEGEYAASASLHALGERLGIDPALLLVCSTGLIGKYLEYEKIILGVPDLVAGLGDDELHGQLAARAIMTTDTKMKQSHAEADGIRVGGMAKGAGMINPDMATMLSVITTDADVSPDELHALLVSAVDKSFNTLSIDGCTSTNDTVCLLASGASHKANLAVLGELLDSVCMDLAKQIAMDAEGATKTVLFKVKGAKDEASAKFAARCVGQSLLVKTSIYGKDVYPGRIVSELGASAVDFDPAAVKVFYGSHCVFAGGKPLSIDADLSEKLKAYMEQDEIEISCDLANGSAEGHLIGTDLGHGYIDENMKTS